MKQEKYYCLVLSESQARFLVTRKYGIDRMKALVSLIEMAATSEREHQMKGFTTTVHVGQVVASEVELSHLWSCTRKTVAKILGLMNQMGLVSTVTTNRTSIHTLLCVSAWQVDGQQIRNGYYVPVKKRLLAASSATDVTQNSDAADSGVNGTSVADHATDATVHIQENGTVIADSRAAMPQSDSISLPSNDTPLSNDATSADEENLDTVGGVASSERQEGKENQEPTTEDETALTPDDLPDEATLDAIQADLDERMASVEGEADSEADNSLLGAIQQPSDGSSQSTDTTTVDAS